MKNLFNGNFILNAKNITNAVNGLYGDDISAQADRYQKLYFEHKERFSDNGFFISSSGRIEVIGNHTDHNNGKVLTAAISLDTLAFVSPSSNDEVCIASCGYPVFCVSLSKLNKIEGEKGTSLALVKGVARWFQDQGFKIGGFSATMISNVFKGAGVSSSASFEVLIAEIFNVLYNDGKVTKMQKAIASQFAENEYFGKPCGLMDQSAIALGGISKIDFKDIENPIVESFKWPFDNVDIIIVNCGGDHSDLTENYSAIRYEMESVAKCFNQTTLRAVDKSDFFKWLPELQTKVSGRALLRAMHYYDENERIDEAVECIVNKNLNGLMEVIQRSGESSYTLLQNCYAEFDKSQRIPLALALSKRQNGVLATRVHGGGFMGTILSFVEKACSQSYIDNLKPVFGEENIFKLNIREDGAKVVKI
ncbi:MAG: galactokinase family protein [Clostridia bacterium]